MFSMIYSLPKAKFACGEGALDIDEALVAAATKAQTDVAFGLNEGAVNKDVKLTHNVQQSRVC